MSIEEQMLICRQNIWLSRLSYSTSPPGHFLVQSIYYEDNSFSFFLQRFLCCMALQAFIEVFSRISWDSNISSLLLLSLNASIFLSLWPGCYTFAAVVARNCLLIYHSCIPDEDFIKPLRQREMYTKQRNH